MYISYTKGNDSQLWNKLVTLPLQLSSPNRHQPPTYQRPPSFALRSARLTRRPPTSDHMIEYWIFSEYSKTIYTLYRFYGFIWCSWIKKKLEIYEFPSKTISLDFEGLKVGSPSLFGRNVGCFAHLPCGVACQHQSVLNQHPFFKTSLRWFSQEPKGNLSSLKFYHI